MIIHSAERRFIEMSDHSAGGGPPAEGQGRPVTKVPKQYLEERRQAILDAAKRVFVTKGYDQATISDIAAEANVAAGSIYRYFENKADLIAAAANDCVEDDLENWSGPLPDGMTPGQAFVALGSQGREDFLRPEHRDEAILRLESYLAASRDEGLRARLAPVMERSVEQLTAFVRAAQESGEFDGRFDPRAFALFLYAVGSGIGSLSVILGDEFDQGAAWDQLIMLAMPSFSPDVRAFAEAAARSGVLAASGAASAGASMGGAPEA
jgi:AcrR family transcriptional regulator